MEKTNNNYYGSVSTMAKGYISNIKFNTGKTIRINMNDIVVFVGPNNVGKSQSLDDIYQLSKNRFSTVVIKDIDIVKEGDLHALLESTSTKSDKGGYIQYFALGHHAVYSDTSEDSFARQPYYNEYRDWFVLKLDTTNRLLLSQPVQSIKRDEPKTNPIHYAAFDKKKRQWLSDCFKKAFGMDVIPNILFGSVIPLCIGEPVKLEGVFESEQERIEEYGRKLESYKQVQNQGDGIKSFTGIILSLMMDSYCTYLIDEPESFLHPPQARIMGQIIGESLSDTQQAFISTHSEDLIKGLLEVCSDRLKIIRITREEDVNSFAVLDNQKVTEVLGDPLLKHSNIMSSLFHKTVVLCESDSDCKLYSVIDSYLKQLDSQYTETLFIHCGGKHRMARTAASLLALDIDVRLISDIDVLNDEKTFKNLIETFGINWETIKTDYNIVVSNLHSEKEAISRNDARHLINQVLDQHSNELLSKKEIEQIQSAVKPISKWDSIKRSGEMAIPAGDATNAYKHLKQILHEHRINIAPVGTLEGFVKEIGGHGPSWVNDVLETFPNLESDVYTKVKEFVKEVLE